MKDNRLNKAIQDLKGIRMTDTEKKAMLARIVSTPVAQSGAASRSVESPWTVYTFNTWISQQRWVVAGLALVIVIGSGGVVSAAEKALPGSILYPIKVDIVEPIRDTLTVSSEAQANWNAEKAERRIEEASALAVAGKLDEATQVDIETRLNKHAEAFDRALEQVRENGDEDRADEISVAFQAGLGARAQMLEVIAENDTASVSPEASPGASSNTFSKRQTRSNQASEEVQDKRVVVASIARSRAESVRWGRTATSDTQAPVTATMSMMMSVEPESVANDVSSDATVTPEAPSIEKSAAKMAPQPQTPQVESESTSTPSAQSKKSVSQKDLATYARRKASADKRILDITARINKIKVAPGSLQGKLFDTTTRNLDEAKNYIREAQELEERGADDEARVRILEAERAAKEAEILFNEGVKSKKSEGKDSAKEEVSKNDSGNLTSTAIKSLEKDRHKRQSSGKVQIEKRDRGEDREGSKKRDFRKDD